VQAAVLGVPFVDVVSTMSDPTLPATVTEYEVSVLIQARKNAAICCCDGHTIPYLGFAMSLHLSVPQQ